MTFCIQTLAYLIECWRNVGSEEAIQGMNGIGRMWPAAVLPLAGYVGLLIVLPLGGVFQAAFSHGWHGFFAALTDPMARGALLLTFATAAVATIADLVVGTWIAFALVRTSILGRSVLNALVDLPLAIPTTVGGMMFVALLGPATDLGQWLERHHMPVVYAVPGIILVQMFVTFPYVVRSVQSVLDGLDPRLEEAAVTLGASRWHVFWRIILPSVSPGIVAGCTMSFHRALSEFGAVVVIAGNVPFHTLTAPVYLYGLLENDNTVGAAAVSVVLLVISGLAAMLQSRFARQHRIWAARRVRAASARQGRRIVWFAA